MPKLGHLMEGGTIVRWIKQVGDTIEKGDILLEIEMDKAIVQVEALFDGVLLKVLVEQGQSVPVGTPLALYGRAGEQV
jgi:pyruvate/2-oxoglutarate dehydrogenase complex dihydrolipoamide acyltransferase (E2) component